MFIALVGSLYLAVAQAGYTNETVQGCSYTDTCSAGGIDGVCVSTSAGKVPYPHSRADAILNYCIIDPSPSCCISLRCYCCAYLLASLPMVMATVMAMGGYLGCCGGTTTSNLCPGSSDIKCCTSNPCSTPSGSGTCEQTSACSGTSYSGYW